MRSPPSFTRPAINESLTGAIGGNRAGFRALRGPVLGGKGHAPESWAGRGKLQADLASGGTHRAEECHVALLFLFGLVVLYVDHGTVGEASGKQNQGPVGVDGKGLREFLEIFTLSVLAAQPNRDLHQHPLTA